MQAPTYPSQVISQPHYYQPNPYYQQPTYNVPSLAVQYIPNVGWRYVAVVPASAAEKLQQLNTNQLSGGYDDGKYHQQQAASKYNNYKYDKYETPNDRYQAKLRKYKAYELLKQKQVPQTAVSNARNHVNFFIIPYLIAND